MFNQELICRFTAVFVIGICQVYPQMVCDTTVKSNDTFVTCKVFNQSGNLIRLKKYHNGKKHGIQEDYYSSGKISNIMSFRDGCLLDSTIEFHENGRISLITYYKNCLCNGLLLAFNEKGDTLHKGQCINGKQIGLDETWFTPGKRETRTHYNDSGKKHGLYETWHEDGTRKDSIVYDNGKMIEVREYFVDGKERMWEEYKKGEKLLLWNAIYHDRTGKVCGKVTNGEGEYILYDENGKYPSKTTISKGITVKEEEM